MKEEFRIKTKKEWNMKFRDHDVVLLDVVVAAPAADVDDDAVHQALFQKRQAASKVAATTKPIQKNHWH